MVYVREFETGERDMTADLLGESLTIKMPGIEANGMAGIDWDVTKAIRAGIRYTAQYNNACDESMGARHHKFRVLIKQNRQSQDLSAGAPAPALFLPRRPSAFSIDNSSLQSRLL
jgi:hypothetical protein